ncbi:hypothetical protein [Geodermatophilus sp. SYSU D00815]
MRPVDVQALTGGSLAELPVLGAVAVVLALGLLVMVRAPRLAFAGWVVSLCFVPVWVGVSIKVGLESHVIASLGLVASLLPVLVRGSRLSTVRLAWGDAVFALFVLASLVPVVSGRVTFSDTFVVAVQWTAAFLAGRLVGYRVPLTWVYGALAIAFTAVAGLALVEFVTGWNPFLKIPGDGSLRAAWAAVQDRGGRTRAEGAFGHSIALGAALALVVPITLAAPFRTALRLGMVVLMLGAAVVTFSRIGLVTAVVGAVLAVLFLRADLPRRLRVAVTAGLVVVGVGTASLVSTVFSAAGTEATNSADYRLELLNLVPHLQPFGWASTAYQVAGRTVLANVPSSDGTLHSIDNALLLVGLSYGWVPMALVLGLLLGAVGWVVSGRATAPTIALVAQIPAFATVALITQYSTFTWFVAGLAVFSQSVVTREAGTGRPPDGLPSPGVSAPRGRSPEMVDSIP